MFVDGARIVMNCPLVFKIKCKMCMSLYKLTLCSPHSIPPLPCLPPPPHATSVTLRTSWARKTLQPISTHMGASSGCCGCCCW